MRTRLVCNLQRAHWRLVTGVIAVSGLVLLAGAGGCEQKRAPRPAPTSIADPAAPKVTSSGEVTATVTRYSPVEPGEFAQVIATLDGPQNAKRTYIADVVQDEDGKRCVNDWSHKFEVEGVGYSRILVWFATNKNETGKIKYSVGVEGQSTPKASEFTIGDRPDDQPGPNEGVEQGCKGKVGEVRTKQVGMPSFARVYPVQAGEIGAFVIGIAASETTRMPCHYTVTIKKGGDAIRAYAKEIHTDAEHSAAHIMVWFDTKDTVSEATTVEFNVWHNNAGGCDFAFEVMPKAKPKAP